MKQDMLSFLGHAGVVDIATIDEWWCVVKREDMYAHHAFDTPCPQPAGLKTSSP